MQAKVACAEGVTRVNDPAVEMQEAPFGYECAGLQANPVLVGAGVTRDNAPLVETHLTPPGYW